MMLSALPTDFPVLASASAADLMAAAEAAFPLAPFVPASTYRRVSMYQEIDLLCVLSYPARPDRPVVMRGAKKLLHMKYSLSGSLSCNGWAAAVFWRWVRMRAITALDYDTWDSATDFFARKLHAKYHLTKGFSDRACVRFPWRVGARPVSGGEVVVGGRLLEADDVHVADALYRLNKERLRAERLLGKDA